MAVFPVLQTYVPTGYVFAAFALIVFVSTVLLALFLREKKRLLSLNDIDYD